MEQNEWQAELARLERVHRRILDRTAEVDAELSSQRGVLTDERRKMWDEEPQFIRSFDDVVTLSQFEQNMLATQSYYNAQKRERLLLSRLSDSPYFGRVDFAEDGEEPESFYIGIGSLTGEDDLERLIYDWRTPIASLFYEQDTGRASYLCPAGEITGELSRKRQYKITGGVLRWCLDTDTTINDELLGEVLAEGAYGHLKTIVRSIQQEQNRVIRAESKRDLLVFGPAGSGKTSVALHRCAYLLYHFRDRLGAGGLLVLSANSLFSSYIAGVLPELGEEDVQQKAFSDLLAPLVPAGYRCCDRYEQMEHALSSPPDDPRTAGMAIKGSAAFLAALRARLLGLRLLVDPVVYEGDVILSAEQLSELTVPRPGGTLADRLRVLYETIDERVDDYFRLHHEQYRLQLFKELQGAVEEKELELQLFKRQKHWKDAVRAEIVRRNQLEPAALYRSTLQTYLEETGGDPAILTATDALLTQNRLAFEDLIPVACIQLLLGVCEPQRQIRQVIVDEAQDFTCMQHFLLQTLFPKSNFTVLADPQQRILRDGVDEKALASLYPNATRMRLDKSYRSTAPINRYAQQFLPPEAVYPFFDRAGDEPVLAAPEDLPAAVSALVAQELARGAGTVCVLTHTAAQAKALAEQVPSVALVTAEDDVLPTGPMLLPAALVKGLEFDAAIVIDDGRLSDHLRYVLATRALHRLYVLREQKA